MLTRRVWIQDENVVGSTQMVWMLLSRAYLPLGSGGFNVIIHVFLWEGRDEC